MRDASSGVKLKIALFGELSLEEAMDLSRDRQIIDLLSVSQTIHIALNAGMVVNNDLEIM
jgi:hypothetical protein